MHHRYSSEGDSEALAFPEVRTSLSAVRRSGQPVILQFQKPVVAAASMALEDASSSDWDVPPTIGELAVKLVADWSLPRLLVLTQRTREG